MKYFTILLLFCLSINSFAQITKTYSGDLYSGKVTYSYYDDTLTNNEVRHGTYKYLKKESYQGQVYSETVTGNYKHGYKNGIFTYTKVLIDVENDQIYTSGTEVVKMSYKEGIPHGEWSYKSNFKIREKKYSLSGWSWSPYEVLPSETVVVNFTNGVMTGKVYVNTDISKINGQLDNKGRWVGEWKIDNSELTLDSGFVVKYKMRNGYSTEITSQGILDAQMREIVTQLKQLPIEQIREFCDKNNLHSNIEVGSNYYRLFDDGYFNKNFIIESEIGVKPLNPEDRYSYHKRYGYVVFIKRN